MRRVATSLNISHFIIMKGDNYVMSMKLVKKFIAMTMAATLMVAPVITASAATGDAEAEVKTAASASVSGQVIKSDVPGAYSVGKASTATQIAAVVPRESTAEIKAEAGLAPNEAPYVQAYDITEKKAPAAYNSANAVAASTGGIIGGAINLKLAKKAGTAVTNLPETVAVPMTFALKSVPAGKRAVVVRIASGGAFTILEDMGTTPGAITVPVTGGDAAYFIMFI